MKKEVLEFNERAFLAKKSELLNRVQQKNEALQAVKRITKDEIKTLDFDKVCKYLNNKSGFENAEMSAKAFNVSEEFSFIKQMSNSQHKDEELIEFKNNRYSFDQDALREVYTTYMDEAYMNAYKDLLKAVGVLNKVPRPLRRMLNLNAESITIDKAQFQTLMQLVERG